MALLTLFLMHDDFSETVSRSVSDLTCDEVWLLRFGALGCRVWKLLTPTIELLALSG